MIVALWLRHPDLKINLKETIWPRCTLWYSRGWISAPFIWQCPTAWSEPWLRKNRHLWWILALYPAYLAAILVKGNRVQARASPCVIVSPPHCYDSPHVSFLGRPLTLWPIGIIEVRILRAVLAGKTTHPNGPNGMSFHTFSRTRSRTRGTDRSSGSCRDHWYCSSSWSGLTAGLREFKHIGPMDLWAYGLWPFISSKPERVNLNQNLWIWTKIILHHFFFLLPSGPAVRYKLRVLPM